MYMKLKWWHRDLFDTDFCNLEMKFTKLKGDIDAQVFEHAKQLLLISKQVKIYDEK